MSLFKDLILKAKNSAIPLIGSYSAIRANAAGDLLRDHAGGSDTIAQISGTPTDGQLFKWSSGRLAPYTGREVLEADLTLYVRTDGSDSNDGRTDSAGGAFLTPQRMIDEFTRIDGNGYKGKGKLANGVYTQALDLKSVVGFDSITIEGNMASPSSVIIQHPTDLVITNTKSSSYILQGFTVRTTGTSFLLVGCGEGQKLKINNLIFGEVNPSGYQIYCFNYGLIQITDDYAITAGGLCHIYCLNGSIEAAGITVTISNNPSFSFFVLMRDGNARLEANTYSGSVSGQRYNITLNAILNTQSGNPNYLPGSTAGFEDTGARYT